MKYEEIAFKLGVKGQEHLLRFWDELGKEEQARMIGALSRIDWDVLELPASHKQAERGKIEPIEALSREEIARDRSLYLRVGEEALRRGKAVAVLLAGGQGTRLGTSAPKGTFDIGLTRPLYIFECLIGNLLSLKEQTGAYVPLLIMTSEKNDRETRAFLREHGYFGYPADFIRFFVQEMAPAVDFSGKLLLEEKGMPALSPNGNGGWYSSLEHAGLLREFPEAEWFNVFSVDNVLQKICDPVFLGATILSGKLCGAKVVSKTSPEEKVGVLCLEDGLPSVVEYYELPEEMRYAVGKDGKLLYRHGVILNYLFHAGKLREIAKERIPVHMVKKKVPYLNNAGELVRPETENAYKFETLILDMIKLMGSCLPYEVVREHEFAPVKNATGADSVESARELLKQNGVTL